MDFCRAGKVPSRRTVDPIQTPRDFALFCGHEKQDPVLPLLIGLSPTYFSAREPASKYFTLTSSILPLKANGALSK